MVVYCTSVSAQSWSLWFPTSPTSVTDCLERSNGKLVVLTQGGRWWSFSNTDGSATLNLVSPDGTLLGSVVMNDPVGSVRATCLEGLGVEGAFAVVGEYNLNNPAVESHASQAALWVVDDQLDYDSGVVNGPPLLGQNLNASCRMPDGRIASMAWAVLDSAALPVRGFKTYLWSTTGSALSDCLAYPGQTGWFEPYSLHPWPQGGLLATSNSPWAGGSGISINVLHDDACSPMFSTNTPPVAFGEFGFPLHQYLNSTALPMDGGRILTAGTYLSMDPGDRTALQVIDGSGQLIRQRTMHSTFVEDRSGLYGNLDTVGTEFYYAQMDNGILIGHPTVAGQANRIHIWRLDTLLNTTAEHVIDGIPDGTQYTVVRIKTARSGGLYVFGEAIDVNGPAEDNHAWVAYVAPEDFSLSISRPEELVSDLFPNPGTTSFQLSLRNAVAQVRLELVDLQGRVVLEQGIAGLNHLVSTNALAPGVYVLRLTDRDGSLQVVQRRWVKE